MQNCCKQHECSCSPVPPWKITPTIWPDNKAIIDSNEFSLFSFSYETHIHDLGQILKKGLLPNHRGSTPTSYSFTDKIIFEFFQLLRQSFAASHQLKPRILDKPYSKLRTQFFLRCLQVWSREPTPVLFMISHHSAFRHRIAACPGWEESFRATCPAHPYTAAKVLCHRDGRFKLPQSFLSHGTNPSTEHLGLYVHPACSEATLFPGWKQAAVFLSTESSIPNPTKHLKPPLCKTF